MSKNVHSEEEWDILSDPEDKPSMDETISANNEVKIEIKETLPTSPKENSESTNIVHLEIMLDDIEEKTNEIERRRFSSQSKSPIKTNKKIEEKKLIETEDEGLCYCLTPYVKSNNCKIL